MDETVCLFSDSVVRGAASTPCDGTVVASLEGPTTGALGSVALAPSSPDMDDGSKRQATRLVDPAALPSSSSHVYYNCNHSYDTS